MAGRALWPDDVSLIRVTAAVRARSLPSTTTASLSVIESSAMIVPLKASRPEGRGAADLPVDVASLGPAGRVTLLSVAVVSPEPIWKMKTALGSPSALRVTLPVSPRVDEAL